MRPIIALDVDGVLNADAFYDKHPVNVPAADLPDSPFIRGNGRQDLSTTLSLHPAHRYWLADLATMADLVWATTWESAANRYIAPLLGLPQLPIATSTEGGPVRKWGTGTAEWKAQCLEDFAADRPLIWIDDMALAYSQDWQRSTVAPTLVLVPHEHEGMQKWHVEAMKSFLAHVDEELVEAHFCLDSGALLQDGWWLERLGVPSGVSSAAEEGKVVRIPHGLIPAVIERLTEALTRKEPWPGARAAARRDLDRLRAS